MAIIHSNQQQDRLAWTPGDSLIMSLIIPKIFDQLEAELKATAISRSPVWLKDQLRGGSYVYGGGSFGLRVANLLKGQGFPCHGIIDRRAGEHLRIVGEWPVIHPESLTAEMCRGQNFVLGVFNPFNDMGEIIRSARTFGFNQIFWGADLPDALGPSLNDFWLSGRQLLLDNFHHIRSLGEVLSDQTSIDTLITIIRFRALDGDKPNPQPSFGTQYLPSELPVLTDR